jgi:hypothetical protein
VRLSSQIEATTAETKTKNQNEKMKTNLKAKPDKNYAKLIDNLNGTTYVKLITCMSGIIPLFEFCGHKFTGFLRHEELRKELQDMPTFDGLIGPLLENGLIVYMTEEASADLCL